MKRQLAAAEERASQAEAALQGMARRDEALEGNIERWRALMAGVAKMLATVRDLAGQIRESGRTVRGQRSTATTEPWKPATPSAGGVQPRNAFSSQPAKSPPAKPPPPPDGGRPVGRRHPAREEARRLP
eukprot:3206417-Prymnesium_polylepis.1